MLGYHKKKAHFVLSNHLAFDMTPKTLHSVLRDGPITMEAEANNVFLNSVHLCALRSGANSSSNCLNIFDAQTQSSLP